MLHDGDKVSVRTVDGGRLPYANNRRAPLKVEVWIGYVIGPSVIGPGWWMIKRSGRQGGRSYAVPEAEITKVVTVVPR